jgi:uncharacterized protein YbjT (DUF2867 family)
VTTLVIGARGSIGGHVLDRLRTDGEPVRASVRHRAQAGFPQDVDVVEADLTDAGSLRAALTGVRRVFLYAPGGGADAFVEAARDANLERVVVLSSGSVLLPHAVGNAIAEGHRRVERALTDAGLPWTPVRPLVLAGNALNWAENIRSDNMIRLVHPEAVTAPVHERDVAAVAVAALRGAAHPDLGGMLTGPELLTQREQVDRIAAARHRDIRIVEITEDEARDRYARAGDPGTVEAVLQFIAAAAQGRSPRTDTVDRVLGRPPVSFGAWARDHAAEIAPRSAPEIR